MWGPAGCVGGIRRALGTGRGVEGIRGPLGAGTVGVGSQRASRGVRDIRD